MPRRDRLALKIKTPFPPLVLLISPPLHKTVSMNKINNKTQARKEWWFACAAITDICSARLTTSGAAPDRSKAL